MAPPLRLACACDCRSLSSCNAFSQWPPRRGGGRDRQSLPPRWRTTRPLRLQRARETKQALVLGLLRRKQGASLAELVAATSWLPHTTRAALTRLRQGGHDLQKEKREYRRDGLPDRARPRGSRAQGRGGQ